MKEILGYQRQSGPPGIRNVIASIHTVECSSFVSQQIAAFDPRIHALGFPGCYGNEYAARLMTALGTHPNVGAVLLVSLGCEGTDAAAMAGAIHASGRPVEVLRIQETGGTQPTIERGRSVVARMLAELDRTPRVPLALRDLRVERQADDRPQSAYGHAGRALRTLGNITGRLELPGGSTDDR